FLSHTPATSDLYTLSLHDALPILPSGQPHHDIREVHPEHERTKPIRRGRRTPETAALIETTPARTAKSEQTKPILGAFAVHSLRSEEHTSELQSRFDLVCRLLLEK